MSNSAIFKDATSIIIHLYCFSLSLKKKKKEEVDLQVLRVTQKQQFKDEWNTPKIVAKNNQYNPRKIAKEKQSRKQKWEEKQLSGYFKRQTAEIAIEMTWI